MEQRERAVQLMQQQTVELNLQLLDRAAAADQAGIGSAPPQATLPPGLPIPPTVHQIYGPEVPEKVEQVETSSPKDPNVSLVNCLLWSLFLVVVKDELRTSQAAGVGLVTDDSTLSEQALAAAESTSPNPMAADPSGNSFDAKMQDTEETSEMLKQFVNHELQTKLDDFS